MSNTIDSSQPPPPLPIKRLQESLINRIAAGEVIHRPASALKELIENCLDARSTSIRITVKDGGLKLLQIQDNGCGIRKADLPILAERFTTSKLSTFSDLSRISTYGFRGEALASISHVAHLTVITKTKSEQCAWKAHYSDGALCPAKPGQTVEPKPFAGNDGTLITIEDMFYNTPTRLAALRSSSEEYAKILDVVTRYAVHNPRVSFTCKKAGSSSTEVSTPANSEVPLVIKLLYGPSIAKELLHAKTSSERRTRNVQTTEEMEVDGSAPQTWHAEAYFTSANYQAKKSTLLLFINHRLVESPRIKKAIESVYTGILPKGSFPFVYLSLQVDPESIDVNVHPTKRTVHFLNEDEIMEIIADAIQTVLSGQSEDGTKNSTATSRAFPVQTLLTGTTRKGISKTRSNQVKGADKLSSDEEETDELEPNQSNQAPPKKKTPSHLKVRNSLQDRTLDSMFPIAHPSQIIDVDKASKPSAAQQKTQPRVLNKEIVETQCYLASIASLRQAVLNGKHDQLAEILANHIFVGIIDLARGLALIQYSTRLYLVNYASLA
jgi:DNA mismatch repair protein MLH1